jgi:predicted DNA-binding transcriptional regulator YafY
MKPLASQNQTIQGSMLNSVIPYSFHPLSLDMPQAPKKPVRYTIAQKRKAVEMVSAGHSVADVVKKFAIQNKRTLENWVRLQENGQLEHPNEGRRDNLSVIALHNHLLRVLPDYPAGLTAEAIVDQLASEGVYKCTRTINRHMDILSGEASGYKVIAGPQIGTWCRNKSAKPALRLNDLSVPDALSLALLERFLKNILPTATTKLLDGVFEQAKTKLEKEASKNPLAAWPNVVAVVEPGLEVIAPSIDDDVLHPVQQALLTKETLKVDYAPLGRSTRTHILNPLGLVQCGAITYLIATFSRKAEPILRLPLHRVQSAERTHDRASYLVPDGFTLQGFIDQGGMGFNEQGPIKIRVWVSEMLGPRLEEVKLSSDQKLRPVDGGYELTATLIDSWRLHWWILSKTGDIVVLEPESLRDDIAKILRKGAARYG